MKKKKDYKEFKNKTAAQNDAESTATGNKFKEYAMFPFTYQQSHHNVLRIKLEILYRSFLFDFMILLIITSFVYWLIPDIFQEKILYLQTERDNVWYGIFLVLLCCRMGLFIWYKRTSDNPRFIRVHYRLFILGSSFLAILWGLLLPLMEPPSKQLEIFFILVIFGIVGGGLQSLAISMAASILFVILTLGILSLYLFAKILTTNYDTIYIALFFSTILYIVFLLVQIRRNNKVLQENIFENILNVDLFHDLQKSRKQLEKIIDMDLEGVWCVDESFHFIYVSKRLCEITGYSADELIGKSIFDFLDSESKTIIMQYILKCQEFEELGSQLFEIRFLGKNGKLLTLKVNSRLENNKKADQLQFIGAVSNVSEEIEFINKLEASEKKYKKLLDIIPAGVMLLKKDKICFINNSFMKILNAKNTEEILGKSILEFLASDFIAVKKRRLDYIYKTHGANQFIEEKFKTTEGDIKYLMATSSYFEFEDEPSVLIVAEDISTQKSAMEAIRMLETHDPLTGLASNKLLKEKLAEALIFAKDETQSFLILMYLNLDNFITINDTFGLKLGDQYLQKLAKNLEKQLRKIDFIARTEGDEFAILLRRFPKNISEVSNLAERLNQIASVTYLIEGRSIKTTASIGIAIFPESGDDEHTLMTNSHIAMHEAKKHGGNTFQFFSYKLKSEILEISSYEKQLLLGLDKNEFYLEFQPKVSLKNEQIVGFEALVRWQNPIEGLLLPEKFIPLAESTGLIRPLTLKILQLCCELQKLRKIKSLPLFQIAINLTSYDFQDTGLPEMFEELFSKYDLDPKLFGIEITESSLFLNIEDNRSILSRLRNMGLEISIDDFGTGYSALSYLYYMNADNIKIDRSFIKDLPRSKEAAILVKTIIDMAHNLNIKVIAEGVETQEQMQFLREKNCDTIQGFYISPPLQANKLDAFIAKYI